VRAQAQAVLGRVGLNISDAIRLFLRQVVVARGLPFEVREYPNAVTQAAMLEARQARAGYDAKDLFDQLEGKRARKKRPHGRRRPEVPGDTEWVRAGLEGTRGIEPWLRFCEPRNNCPY